MSKECNKEEAPIFKDEDHLRLLQLMTRSVMAERRAKASDREGEDSSATNSQRKGQSGSHLPQRWQLVPEDASLYDWQRECLPLWISRGHGTVKVATGGGKTLFALAAAQHLQNDREPDLRLVVVVPTIPLMFQWYDEVRRGNLSDSAIGLMGGGRELPAISDICVLICVLNSARERLPGLVAKGHWAHRMLLVVDECHRANAVQARRIFDARPKYTLGLSATPEQELVDEDLPTDEAYERSVVGQALGPIIYDFTIKQSLEAGLLTPFAVWHIGLSLSPTEASEHARLSREIADLRKLLQIRHRRSRITQSFLAWCQTQASRGGPLSPEAERFIGLSNRRKRLLYRAKSRSDIVLGILSEAAEDREGRTIVFHESIQEIESLFLRAVEMGLPAVLEHSQLPDSIRADNIDAFRRGIARIIISAKSLVEGFNVPSADLGIIVASSSSVRQRIQSLGRMLRRKSGGRTAQIIVLYVRDTEDEAIYEKADWESVVGAERNRYFHWRSVAGGEPWSSGLSEESRAPRSYRASSWETDVSDLRSGDLYPAQTNGYDLRVDQSGNLRTDDGVLVRASREIIEQIVARNPYRRARLTPAGHLIVRVDAQGSDEADWQFLGTVELPDESGAGEVFRLRVRTVSARRVIALKEERRKGVRFALGPDASRTPEAGLARDKLLQWTRTIEAEKGLEVKEIFWDGKSSYWLEIQGERIPHDSPLAPLEFEP